MAATSLTHREKIYQIVFESDTRAGRAFDIALLVLILASVLTVMLESVASINQRYGALFLRLEVFYTVIFTLEYLLRLYCVPRPLRYATSFYGVIDLLAVIPGLIGLFVPGTTYLLVVRSLRLLRVFRIFKLVHFMDESQHLARSLWQSRQRIFVFLFVVMIIVIITGSVMYVVEHDANEKFTSIPQSIYWSIVTLTTVGFGDIYPITPLGKFLASFIMILGYAIIAVPTGIITVSMIRGEKKKLTNQTCPNCLRQGHESDAVFCKFCGGKLNALEE
jgi:voltage-gated potassium channel